MTVMKMGLVPIICQMDDPVKADELAKTSGAEKHLIGTMTSNVSFAVQRLNV
jgi:hypothetical protein